jgi:hypothetical protein
LNDPTVFNAQIRGSRVDEDSLPGHVGVEIAPSVVVRNGLYLAINDHFDITRSKNDEERDEQVQHVLFDLWDGSRARGQELAANIAHAIDVGATDA